jgi:hypothetical protein
LAKAPFFQGVAIFGTSADCRFDPQKVLPRDLKFSENFSQFCNSLKAGNFTMYDFSAEISA